MDIKLLNKIYRKLTLYLAASGFKLGKGLNRHTHRHGVIIHQRGGYIPANRIQSSAFWARLVASTSGS
jgi:hypothetical protein